MRKSASYLSVFVFVLTSMSNLYAASLAGVTMPDTAQVEGKTLVLNGLGLRTKYMAKIYVAGLYLEQKSSDPNAIINSNGAQRVVMQFLHGVSKSQMADGFSESFADNTPDATKTMKPEIDQFLGAMEPLKSGDQMVFTCVPGKGTTMTINGTEKLTIANPAFTPVLLSVWFGPKPPTADLKTGLLGK